MYLSLIIILTLCLTNLLSAQTFRGKVLDSVEKTPLSGATVRWITTSRGAITNKSGEFTLDGKSVTDRRIITRYVGYKPDTLAPATDTDVLILLKPDGVLDNVEVSAEREATYTSVETVKTEVITMHELKKDACCDLSGCFGSNSSVDVQVTDVITDSKELKILGLSGAYTHILVDGMPLLNGLPSHYGLSAIPGAWIDQISITKGSNSVLQGFEGIGGIVNFELKKPQNTEKLSVNGYANSFFEKHLNALARESFGEWNTLLGAFIVSSGKALDENSDGFLDAPHITRTTLFNKWTLEKIGIKAQFSAKFWSEERVGGSKFYNADNDKGSTSIYGQVVDISHGDFYGKSSFELTEDALISLSANGILHTQHAWFGITKYDAKQQSVYANAQYELLWLESHELRVGASMRHSTIRESIAGSGKSHDGNYDMTENIPGIFAENTFKFDEGNVVAILGARADYHNEFGTFFTPRLLVKYQMSDLTTLRASVGSGFRTAKIFSENPTIFASARTIFIQEKLEPEKAWNFGVSIVHLFDFFGMGSTFSADFYRNEFTNQIIADYEQSPSTVYFTNIRGGSVSNTAQAEWKMEVGQGFNAKFGYTFLDAYRTENGEKRELPLNTRHKVLASLSWESADKEWNCNAYTEWFGTQKLPSTAQNPTEYQRPSESEPYMMVNAQVTKIFGAVEVYFGAENILNQRQPNPIIGANEPFGKYFDTSLIWGPIKGREFYAGIRWKMP